MIERALEGSKKARSYLKSLDALSTRKQIERKKYRELRADTLENISTALALQMKWECERVLNTYASGGLLAYMGSLAMDIANALNTHPHIRRKYNKKWNVSCSANMGIYVVAHSTVMFSHALTGLCICVWTDGSSGWTDEEEQ